MENKIFPKILILRIFNHSKSYDQMYDLHMKNDKSLFVVFDNTLSEECIFDKNKRIIKIRGEESFIPGIMEKTLKGIEFCLKEFLDWDILIRSNISTIINETLIQKHIHSLYPNGNSKLYGGHIWADLVPFVSGTSIILSRDLCELLIKRRNTVRMDIIDDVSIGFFYRCQNILPNLNIEFVYAENRTENYFTRFRKDCSLSSDNRDEDVEAMKQYYAKYF